MDEIQRIREAHQSRQVADSAKAQHDEQLKSNAAMQQAMFETFQAVVSAVKGDQSKAEAIAHILKVMESMDGKFKDQSVELETLRSGLDTLQKELSEIPTGDLKQIPKFLQQRDTVKVSNLDELKTGLNSLEKAVKALELHVEAPEVNVEAPNVNVPAPVVNVPELNLDPLKKSISSVQKAIEANKNPDVVKTEQTNVLITEKFDEYKLVYDSLDEDDPDPKIEAIQYFLKGKKVARINYVYEDDRLVGAKKA